MFFRRIKGFIREYADVVSYMYTGVPASTRKLKPRKPHVTWEQLQDSHAANTPEFLPVGVHEAIKLMDVYCDLRSGLYMPTSYDYKRRSEVIDALYALGPRDDDQIRVCCAPSTR